MQPIFFLSEGESTRDQVPFAINVSYSSDIALNQWGQWRETRIFGGSVSRYSVRRIFGFKIPSLARVTMGWWEIKEQVEFGATEDEEEDSWVKEGLVEEGKFGGRETEENEVWLSIGNWGVFWDGFNRSRDVVSNPLDKEGAATGKRQGWDGVVQDVLIVTEGEDIIGKREWLLVCNDEKESGKEKKKMWEIEFHQTIHVLI